MKIPTEGGISIKVYARVSSCKGSLNKNTDLLSNKLYASADATKQIKSLHEIQTSVYKEMGVVFYDLALLVVWADRGSPRA